MNLCVNCKHYESFTYDSSPFPWSSTKWLKTNHFCYRHKQEIVSPVTGEKEIVGNVVRCDIERTDSGSPALSLIHCGKEGKFFEPRE